MKKILLYIDFSVMGTMFLCFIYFGFRLCSILFRLVDEINRVVPPDKQSMYYGLPILRSYWRHKGLFPHDSSTRQDARTLFRKTVMSAACVYLTVLCMSFLLD
jgi:hypothetical protein